MKLFYYATPVKFFIVIFFTIFFQSVYAGNNSKNILVENVPDTFNIKSQSFLLPLAQPKKKYTSALYLLNVIIPRDWTLDMIKAPMFSYAGKYVLPYGLNLQASLSTLFISNRITFGPFYNYSINNYHFGVGYQIVYNYGVLKQFGFHTKITGWEQQPTAIIGYSFQTMALILRGDLYWTNALYVSEGGNVIPYTDSFINGWSVSLSLEQRLWKNRVLSFGFKSNYLKYHILAWPAFPVNNYQYVVPEFQMGLNF